MVVRLRLLRGCLAALLPVLCIALPVKAQSFEPVWQVVGAGSCLGCAGLRSADLDGDEAEEILFWTSDPYGSASLFGVYDYQSGAYELTWVGPVDAGARLVWMGVADADKDGGREVYAVRLDGTVEVYDPREGVMLRSTPFLRDNPVEEAAIANVDGDAGLELVLLTPYALRVYRLTDLTLERETPYFGGRALAIGNVDRDAAPEIVIDTWDGSTAAGLVTNGATGTVEWTYHGGFGNTLVLADASGDGVNDVIGTTGYASLTAIDVVHRTPIWQINAGVNLDGASLHVADVQGTRRPELFVGPLYEQARAFDILSGELLWEIPAAAGPGGRGLTTGDPDGDGEEDIILASADGQQPPRLFVLRAEDRQVRWRSTPSQGPFGVVAVPGEGPGRNDLLVLNLYGEQYEVFTLDVLDPSTHEARSSTMLPTDRPVYLRAAADLDGDGSVEAILTEDYQLLVVEVATGTILHDTELLQGRSVLDVKVGDVDADGDVEVVLALDSGHVEVRDGATLEVKWRSIGFGLPIYGVTLQNLDRDAALEIVFFNNIVQAYDGQTHKLEWQAEPGGIVSAVDTGDLTGDGVRDLVVGHGNMVSVLDGKTRGLLYEAVVAPSTVWHLRVLNVDATPEPEIVVGSRELLVLRGSDLAVLWRTYSLGEAYRPLSSLEVGDFDVDGHMEIAYATGAGIFHFESPERYLDVMPPVVLAVTPPPGLENVGTGTPFTVRFSEPIDVASLDASSIIVTADGLPGEVDLRFEAGARQLTLTPRTPFPENALLSITLPGTLTDTTGNQLDANGDGRSEGTPEDDYTWTFTTGSAADTVGPALRVTSIEAEEAWQGMPLRVRVVVTDTSSAGTSLIAGVEAFIDEVGPVGEGIPLLPEDGIFSSPVEAAVAEIDTDAVSPGQHTLYLRALDTSGNAGDLVAIPFSIRGQEEEAWPMVGGGPAHAGYAPADDFAPPFTTMWTHTLKNGDYPATWAMEPVIGEGKLFVAWKDVLMVPYVTAFEAASGQVLWTTALLSGGTPSGPAYAYGRLYIQVSTGEATVVYALDPEDGSVEWEEEALPSPYWSFYAAPTISDGRLLLGGHDTVYALDASDGALLWRVSAPGMESWTPAIHDDVVYFFSRGVLTAVDVRTGNLIWRERLGPSRAGYFPTPVVDAASGMVFAASAEALYAFDLATRTMRWQVPVYASSVGLPAVDEENVYITTSGTVEAYDKETGAKRWALRPDDVFVGGSVSVIGAYLFTGAYNRTAVIDRESREVVWEAGGGWVAAAAPWVFTVTLEGAVTALLQTSRVGAEEAPIVPTAFRLHANYPNPFNPSTVLTYELPRAAEVRLAVYDVLGREVAVLVEAMQEAGTHRVTFDASRLASGTYFYRLHTPQGPLSGMMSLVR